MVEVAIIKVMGIKITGRDIIMREETFNKRGISSSTSSSRENPMINMINNITKSSTPNNTMMKRSMNIAMRGVALRSRNNKLLRSSILNRITLLLPQAEGQYS